MNIFVIFNMINIVIDLLIQLAMIEHLFIVVSGVDVIDCTKI